MNTLYYLLGIAFILVLFGFVILDLISRMKVQEEVEENRRNFWIDQLKLLEFRFIPLEKALEAKKGKAGRPIGSLSPTTKPSEPKKRVMGRPKGTRNYTSKYATDEEKKLGAQQAKDRWLLRQKIARERKRWEDGERP